MGLTEDPTQAEVFVNVLTPEMREAWVERLQDLFGCQHNEAVIRDLVREFEEDLDNWSICTNREFHVATVDDLLAGTTDRCAMCGELVSTHPVVYACGDIPTDARRPG